MSNLTSLVEDNANGLADRVDNLTQETAGNFHAAADSIRQSARQGSKAIENIAQTAADKLDGVGARFQKHPAKKMVTNSRIILRKYPAEFLAIASGVGFLIGLALCRLTHAPSK